MHYIGEIYMNDKRSKLTSALKKCPGKKVG
jgi:hypothetical protein